MTPYTLTAWAAYVRKALINAAMFAGGVLTVVNVPDPYKAWITTGIAVVGVISHFAVSNAAKPGTVPASDDTAADAPDTYENVGASPDDVAGVDPVPTDSAAPSDPPTAVDPVSNDPPAAPVDAPHPRPTPTG